MKSFIGVSVIVVGASFGVACAVPDIGEEQQETSSAIYTSSFPAPTSIVPGDLVWSYAGPIRGKACVLVNEPADPYTWADNFLCSNRDYGLRWSFAGPIPNMTCTAIYEAAAPAWETWADNFLCAPRDYGLQFSSAGPIAGKQCVLMNEPAEPAAYTFSDNYLCYGPSTDQGVAGPSSGVQIQDATYGGNVGVSSGNATNSVARACNGHPSCDYLVSVNELGDPAYGRTKDFSVHYTCSGQPRQAYLNPEANGAHVYLYCDAALPSPASPPPPPPPAPSPPSCGVLGVNGSLAPNQGVTSCNGRNLFVYQGDSNLVLYHDGKYLWGTMLLIPNPGAVVMQGDGNLVEYDAARKAVWASATQGNPGAWLAVQDDCNVVIYSTDGRVLRSTNTSGCVQH
jgi:hypothetical protein